MTTLILLGAGASFGSEPDKERHRTPPLGTGLFSELCELGKVAASIPDDLKAVFSQDFETGMAAFYDRSNEKLQSFHRELASYLGGFTPSTDNYYLKLIRLFEGRDVIFGSLNYDMMLEESVFKLGLCVTYGNKKSDGFVRILKPHGSMNFWPVSPHQMFQNCVFGDLQTAYNGPAQALSRLDALFRCGKDTSLSPAISMYAKGKKVSVCTRIVSNQQTAFTEVCGRASKIIIMGVKVVPEDEHIWRPIMKARCNITYFGSLQDEKDLNALVKLSGRKNVKFVEGFFDKLLDVVDPDA